MATIATTPRPVTKGGSFLVESRKPEEIFTPADLTDDHKLIGQTAEEFVTNEVLPLAHELEEKKPGLMPALLKKAGELGLLGGGVPEQYGGSGLDKISSTVLAEKLSLYASFAVSHGGHAGIGTIPIVYYGTEEQKKKYLPKIASGEWLSCYCLSEPQAGSDAQNLLTTAKLSPDGQHWILDGQKMWITNGGFADVFIVFAKVDGEKLSCFIVEKTHPGLKIGGEEKKMGIKGSSTVPIFLDNCKISKDNLLYEIGGGFKVAVNTLNVGRFNLGAYCLGGAKNVLAVTAKYAKERKAFGKTLADFGLIQEKLAEMALRIFAVESMIYRSAGMIEAAMDAAHGATDKTAELMRVLEEYAIESSISKVYGSETLDFVDKTLAGLDRATPIAVFTHFPTALLAPMRLTNAEALLDRFKGHNLQAVLSGHFHATTRHVRNGVALTTNRCCSFRRGNHDHTPEKGYVVVRAEAGELRGRFVEFKAG